MTANLRAPGPGTPGPPGPPGPSGPIGGQYHHIQVAPASTWVINHGLGFKPGGVMVQDSAGETFVIEPTYIDDNTLELDVGAVFAGHAYLS